LESLDSCHELPLVLTMLKPLPDRQQFEREIRELLTDGDIVEVARYLKLDRSQTSRQFNPNVPERKNPFWCALEHFWCFDAIRPGLTERVQDIIVRYRLQWLPAPRIQRCAIEATSRIGREFMDLVEKELAGMPIDVQLKEALDIKAAVDAKVEEILARDISRLRAAA
jgi:hypothetical protein